jgi:putative FmdB family regulatory protein
MPTYEYVCKKCKAHLDIFHSMKDADLKICPKEKCPKKVWGKGAMVKQMGTGAGFIFKGSGFYITDYRSAGYKKAAKEASGGGEKSGEKSSEKKKAPESGTGSGTTAGGATKAGEGKSGKSK